MQLIRHDININFLENRKYALILSTVLVLVSLSLLAFKGLNLGIDFSFRLNLYA
jgi:preprotein translocase subunit SecF